jgi:hypothetical protein
VTGTGAVVGVMGAVVAGGPQPKRGMQEPLAGLHFLQVSHALALPPLQIPLKHFDPKMHKLPLLHGLPFCFLLAEHCPVLPLQVLQASHFLEVPPSHFPFQHRAPMMHLFPNLHPVPFFFLSFMHFPFSHF